MGNNLILTKNMTEFKLAVEKHTSLWLMSEEDQTNDNGTKDVFVFYTNGENIKEKLHYLSEKRDIGCFWNLYYYCGLFDAEVGNEIFRVQIDTNMSIKDHIYEFKQLVDSMTKEYIEKEGKVNCEFFTSSNNLHDKLQYLCVKQKAGVVWSINFVSTYKNDASDKPYCVEIIGFY